MRHGFDFSKQKELIRLMAKRMNRHELVSFILSHAQKTDTKRFKKEGTEEIIHMTNPCNVIPDIYHEYRQIVHDGIYFLLSHFSLSRFVQLAVEQFQMKGNISDEARLIGLARQIPTLHKLGQIIARNRNLDESFRKWLIHLENDIYQGDIHALKEKVKSEIGGLINIFSIQMGDNILAEASVGAVMPFTWRDPGTERREKGVFKLLKPTVREYLKEELELLDRLAIFFDENRSRYTLKNFRFIETFRDIKEALQKEVDLLGEQNNLKKAAWFYGKEKTAAIPILLPFSTENMTAMEHMRGGKITDGHIQPENKKKLAQMLFKSVIWRPLFSRQERTLFHGDPHAGNIYAYEENQGKIKLILLDWSQTGELSKKQRISIFTLAIGIFLEDKQLICKAINELSQDKDLPEEPYLKKMLQIIEDISDSPQYRQCKMIQSIFFVIDQMVIQGIRFPKDLLLLRKAFFTLEGVLYDLDPEFDMDRYVLKLIESLFIEELPKRWLYFLFPQSDNWNHYKSLMSNHDVQALVNRIFMKCLQKGITRIADHILPAPIHR